MPTVIAPTDPRPQFSMMDVVLANARLGRLPMQGAEQVGVDRYVLGSSPPRANGISPAMVAMAVKQRGG